MSWTLQGPSTSSGATITFEADFDAQYEEGYEVRNEQHFVLGSDEPINVDGAISGPNPKLTILTYGTSTQTFAEFKAQVDTLVGNIKAYCRPTATFTNPASTGTITVAIKSLGPVSYPLFLTAKVAKIPIDLTRVVES